MTELQRRLTGSAETWRSEPPDPALPRELTSYGQGSARDRLSSLRQRHGIRKAHAERVFSGAMNPARGLPVAPGKDVSAFAVELVSTRKAMVAGLVLLHAGAAVAALMIPRLLGSIVDAASVPGDLAASLNSLTLSVAAVVVLQAVLTFAAMKVSVAFGQDVLAAAREKVVRTVLRLPLGRVEASGSGDLVTRVTRDVSTMSESVREGFPELGIASVTTLLFLVAMVLNSPLLTLVLLATVPLLVVAVARYLRPGSAGYIAEGATYSQINSSLTETVEGARTVEALSAQRLRIDQGDTDIDISAQAERYTLTLRNFLFAGIDLAYLLPLVLTLVMGVVGYSQDWLTLGQITTAILYVQLIIEPIDRLIRNLTRLQVGIASTSRLLGIAAVPADRVAGEARPDNTTIEGSDLRFAYREDRDVLHGVDVALQPGERLAIVGPSGSGKSTLGRLLSGINGPRTGSVTVGNVDLLALPVEVLRTEVALVTQEHHVFIGTIRDNIILARESSADADVIEALRLVEAWPWVNRLLDGLDTMLGAGHLQLTPGQAQQIALARLVLADPHTLVLDEATSLIDPKTARHLEGSIAALIAGRAVVAIAHRLHSAHDADRIAVVIDGRIAELGSHEELIGAGGEYAALWQAWTS